MRKLRGLFDTSYNHGIATILVVVFCLAQLSGCSVVNNGSRSFASSSYDGPPGIDVDVSKVRDAVPKVEPLHPYCSRDYVIRGHRYRVLKSPKGYDKKGYASWYGSGFHGKETATQEKFNMYAMTAASPELPLPSYVQVTNLRNGRKVIVRVNDHGPHYGKRILDLSYVAAMKLGFADSGVVPVRVVAIDPTKWGKASVSSKKDFTPSRNVVVAQAKQPSNKSQLFLQVGAFAEFDNAKQVSTRVNQLVDRPVQIKRKSDLYRVQIGPVASSNQGDKLKLFLEENGFENVSVVEG